MMPDRSSFGAAIVLLAVATACAQEEVVPVPYIPSNAHEAYGLSLRQAGLQDSALGRNWLEAATASLQHSLLVKTPFKETVYIDSSKAFAIGYRFRVLRGHRSEVQVTIEGGTRTRLFLDLFRAEQRRAAEWRLVASSPAEESRLTFEPRQDGDYVLRVQPELLGGGSATIEIRSVAILSFPVENRSPRDIGSRFGVSRDGGRRSHHGVDIFAPRHTPVLAPISGTVRRVGTNRLGGNIIWLYDSGRSLHFYFAHLQSQTIEAGASVNVGQQIGTVGNSGNARTTPPHLHFGIYKRGKGPLDPDPFLKQPPLTPPDLVVDAGLLGRLCRTAERSRIEINDAPGLSVEPETPLRLLAARGNSFRVELPGGQIGYIRGDVIEPADTPLAVDRLEHGEALWPGPRLGFSPLAWIDPGTRVETIGFAGGFRLLRTPSGQQGWSESKFP